MEIRLLNEKEIKTEEFYNDFLEGNINSKEEYFDGNVITIEEAPDFPIYIAKGSEDEKKVLFSRAINIISEYYINIDRDIHMNKMFWYSLFCTKKREYLLNEYPQIKDSKNNFHNIVLKKFDWENYVYKCILAAEYIKDYTDNEDLKEVLIDFIKMRKTIKSPVTDRALKGILNKLDQLANEDKTKIGILEQSIINSWKSVFPLKEQNKFSTNSSVSKNNNNIQNSYKKGAGANVNETFRNYDPSIINELAMREQQEKINKLKNK